MLLILVLQLFLFASHSLADETPIPLGSPIHVTHVPVYPHRRFGGESVTRNRLALLGGLQPLNESQRVTVQQLRQTLQCATDEPDIVGDRGSVLLALRMVPPTREATRLLAVWGETLCEGWAKCREELAKWDAATTTLDWGGKQHGAKGILSSPFQVRMLRIIKGKLYYDWPFHNKERFGWEKIKGFVDPTKTSLIKLILGKVSDLQDTPPFLFGEEVAFMPHSFPFFAFSASPTMRNADMPWPWHAHIVKEVERYGTNISELLGVGGGEGEGDWGRRSSKAAFYGSMSRLRHVFFDVAAANPDLFDVGWTGSVNSKPWNPAATETGSEAEFQIDSIKLLSSEERQKGGAPGLLKSLFPSHIDQGVSIGRKYKYIVVLIGGSDNASADRLAELMLNSGAVLLLQKHDFEYHFSSRLKPYVHFVPLTYSAADAAEKVKWLQQNDHLAKTLAANARNFALSHLRLEDIVCYAASALKVMAYPGADWPGWEPQRVRGGRDGEIDEDDAKGVLKWW